MWTELGLELKFSILFGSIFSGDDFKFDFFYLMLRGFWAESEMDSIAVYL